MASQVEDKSYKMAKGLIRKKNLANIQLATQVPTERLPSSLNGRDIFLNAPKYGSFNLANMQAAASRICIVTLSAQKLPFVWDNARNAIPREREKSPRTVLMGSHISAMGQDL